MTFININYVFLVDLLPVITTTSISHILIFLLGPSKVVISLVLVLFILLSEFFISSTLTLKMRLISIIKHIINPLPMINFLAVITTDSINHNKKLSNLAKTNTNNNETKYSS